MRACVCRSAATGSNFRRGSQPRRPSDSTRMARMTDALWRSTSPSPESTAWNFSVRPLAKSSAGKRVFQWRIPRVNTARLELIVPENARDVEFPTSLGAVIRETDPRRLVVALGPTDELHVRWGDQPSPENRPAWNVEQLLAFRLRTECGGI